MENTTSGNKRVAKNTIVLYIRMFITMVVTLYTSRIILNALGVNNYGIFSVIGGIIGLLAFINNSMAISVQRFLSFELGRNKNNEVEKIFNISIITHLCIGIVIVVLLIALQRPIVDNLLNIPIERLDNARRFLILIAISSGLNMLIIPFIALIIAFERMGIFAWISIFDVLIKLAIAFLIRRFPDSPLISYGYLLIGASVTMVLVYGIVCIIRFKEIKIYPYWNKSQFKELLKFAGWSSLGEISWAFTIQGVNILLNRFFGVVCSAAYGIASQISAATNRFISSFQTALNPRIVKLYASGDVDQMLTLTFSGIRFSFFLLLIIVVPAVSSMNLILKLWLKEVPEYTQSLSSLILIGLLLDSLSTLFSSVAKAYGNIQRYQILISLSIFFNFPISYLVLKLGFPPYSVLCVYCCISIANIILRIYLVGAMLGKHLWRDYLSQVLNKIIYVFASSIIVACITVNIINDSIIRFVIVTIANFIVIVIMGYLTGMNRGEQAFVKKKIRNIIHK